MTRGPLVVVGDALLDIDLEGTAKRLSPDAPVPVLDELVERPRPGGAGLAAVLAAADGHEVVLVAAVANDSDGVRLTGLLGDHGVRLIAVPHDGTTPVKRRVRSADQSLLRLDSGTAGAIHEVPSEALELMRAAGAVLVADYGRGLAAERTVREALSAVVGRVPVVWDPHPRGPAPVAGVRLVTPNRDEAAHFAGDVGVDARTLLGTVSARAAALVERWSVHSVAVTLGAGGALLSHGESSPSLLPAPLVSVSDPCGAGDRFASAATGALARGAVTTEAVQEAVLAAADFVAAGGAAAVGHPVRSGPAAQVAGGLERVERVRAAGGTVVATGGCFDLLHAGHVATLEAARALGDCLVVCLNSDASVRRLKGDARPLVPQDDRARVLTALEPVDAVVVFDEDTPTEALRRVRPDVWAKGGDYAGVDLPEAALLREWGGQSVVLPYLQGRSTTGLVTRATERVAPAR